ncbi:hypothetical protein NDU88_005245 [Pleurodeles waltl]|uniref:Carrier domain-containing protein n=1 Tax=Pleurodeles waltl TaxID=8319 RepID=A0AAV7ME20_PLEWA|nr:hypothetical protein NDU88_005245 [Pleurodeles waltl]
MFYQLNSRAGEGIDNFWKVLVEGKNCTVDIPPERFNINDWYDPDDSKPGNNCTLKAALIDGFNEFDNRLFGINDMEAEVMDPQQKVLLECTFRALENAGIPMEKISGSDTGVFIGLMNQDFALIMNVFPNDTDNYSGTGTSMSIAANRISYCFNLTGPSFALDAACASSLVALHYACQAIKQGDCEMALCGGVSCIMHPHMHISLTKARMLSPEGISKPFSKYADGYGRGEGCGIVLLKPLKKAIEDYDRIWGVIINSAMNQDGRSVTPITKPSQKQQEKLLHKLYTGQTDPSVVQYIEAHGTGTHVGDQIEAASLGNMIGKARRPGLPALQIGSVKGNIGHTESAAGIAGLIKVLLMMHYKTIVPTLHYSEEISSINAKELNLSIPTSVQTWEEIQAVSRIAGVSSFGIGGINSHAVIKQFKQTCVPNCLKRPTEIFVLSAASIESLKLIVEDTAALLNKMDSISLQNLAYTSACRRSHTNNEYRNAFVVSSLTHLKQQLTTVDITRELQVKAKLNIVYVFNGNGVNYKGMCKTLLKFEPVFRDKFKEIEDILFSYTNTSLIDLIESDFEDFSILEIAQPLLFATQVALVWLLKYWGIKPIALVGHSVGEVAAAHCSGLLSLTDAVKVIYHRSLLQSKITGGKMLVVGNVPVAEISKAIDSQSGKVCIAAFNSPKSCTLSGEAEAIESLQKQLAPQFRENNIFLLPLDVPTAYHSHMMDPILHEVEESLRDIKRQGSEMIEIISTVTGEIASEDDFTTGKYWARNVREPVAFIEAIQTACKGKENPVFVQIGPKRPLERNIKEILETETLVHPTVLPSKEYETMFTLLEKLFVLGYNPEWKNVFKGYEAVPALFPRYQFAHKKTTKVPQVVVQGKKRSVNLTHPLLHSVSINNMEFGCTLSETSIPYIYEHKINGIAILPGTFYVELGVASLMNSSLPKIPLGTHQISIKCLNPCIISQGPCKIKIQMESKDMDAHFKVLSHHAVYASGKITQTVATEAKEESISLQHIIKRCRSVVNINKMYQKLNILGFEYGQVYRILSDILYGEDLREAVTHVKVNNQIKKELHEFYIHPVVLDAFVQMTVILATSDAGDMKAKAGFLSSISSILLYRPLQNEMVLYMKISKATQDYIDVCGCFADKNGTFLAELKNVRVAFLGANSRHQSDFLYENKWKDQTEILTLQTPLGALTPLVFADNCGIAEHLKEYLPQETKYVLYSDWKTALESGNTLMFALSKMEIVLSDYNDFLFMWGIHRFKEEFSFNITRQIAECCEAYRQIILALREKKPGALIRTITYRTTESTIDHINPGFGLQGMTRACVTEIPEISFQQIDVGSSSVQDITALANVIANSTAENCPEVFINYGRIYISEIDRTRFQENSITVQKRPIDNSKIFTLYSTDPHKLTEISAELTSQSVTNPSNQNIEVQVTKICAHSEDYFPVTDSSYKFGAMLYWKAEASDKHQLLALDLTGTVTAVGKDVKNIKVGDHITSCYPVTASSKVTLPGEVCHNTRKVPFLKNVPCVSYFWIAWMILHRTLPKARSQASLAIISAEPKSVLCEVLMLTAVESGWKTVIETPTSAVSQHINHCCALVLLPCHEGILDDGLSSSAIMEDIVIVGDSQEIRCLLAQIGNSNDHTTVHSMDLKSIFQKSFMKRFSKPFYVWVESLPTEKFLNLQYTVFQQDSKADGTSVLPPSYFSCTSIPLIVLKEDTLTTAVSNIPVYDMEKTICKCHAVYIVAGGLTGLGFETVKFIAKHGGGYIVILSRRKPTTEMETQIKALQKHYASVTIISLQCDIVFSSEVEKAIACIHKHFPKNPIKGVFHSAVVLRDRLIEHLNISNFEEVLNPKVSGVINLHCATRSEELDYFVCYSSIAAFIGNSGQANYAAANSFLDNFCHYRRNMGLSGQSIIWGALNLGVLENQDIIKQILESKGILTLDLEEIHEHFKKVLILNAPQQLVIKINFNNLNSNVLSLIPSLRNRFNKLLTEELSKEEQVPKGHAPSNLESVKPKDYILTLVRELTHASPSECTMDTSLAYLGIDSMVGMALQNCIYDDRKIKVPFVMVLNAETTVQSLITFLAEKERDVKSANKALMEIINTEDTMLQEQVLARTYASNA